MSALKALKKLKKKPPQVINQSLAQLSALKKDTAINHNHSINSRELKSDIKKLSNEVVLSMVSELSVPLNPLLSWFETSSSPISLSALPSTYNRAEPSAGQQPAINIKTISVNNAVLRQPLKSPPCKRCPALQGGICKCARKKFA